MEMMIAGRIREVTRIKASELLKDVLPSGDNIFIYGTSGQGKSQIIKQYAREHDMDLVVLNLALEVPETVGGIPKEKIVRGDLDTAEREKVVQFFVKLISERIAPLLEDNGRKKLLFLDELNQALEEVFNCLYSVVDDEDPNWAGYPLYDVQVVAAGNKTDGTDGTVYLHEPPTPLMNRFTIFELVPNKKDTKDYLIKKWKNIPQVGRYVDVMLEDNIPPRDIEHILKAIAFKKSPLMMKAKVGETLTIQLQDIEKKVKAKIDDPVKTLRKCREGYRQFKEIEKVGGVMSWGADDIEDEEELLDIFRGLLTEEEVQSIVKDYEIEMEKGE